MRKLYATPTQLHRQLHRTAEALALCAVGREHYPDDAELLFVEALLRREERDYTGAEQCLLRLLEHRETDHFASIDVGLQGYKARHNLAVLYMDTNRLADAATAWHAVLAEEPTFLPAYTGLGELALRQHDASAIETLTAQLERLGTQGQIEAVALRSRWLLATNQLAAARWTLAQALEHHPKALPLGILHSHALLKEGVDMHAAEAALHGVLELDPANAEARHNLAVLREKLRNSL